MKIIACPIALCIDISGKERLIKKNALTYKLLVNSSAN
jgi:hypothetical protein